jgi:hypothetical protein
VTNWKKRLPLPRPDEQIADPVDEEQRKAAGVADSLTKASVAYTSPDWTIVPPRRMEQGQGR